MKPMTEEKVDKVRKRFIALVVIVPVLFALCFVTYLLRPGSASDYGLPAVTDLLIPDDGKLSEFEKDPVGTRKKVLKWIETKPKDVDFLQVILANRELERLEKLPMGKRGAEAKIALQTQLEFFRIMDEADQGLGKVVLGRKISDTLSYTSVLDIAVVAKDSELIRKKASTWAKPSSVSGISNEYRLQAGQIYLGWAAWVEGDYDQAATHLLASGDHLGDLDRKFGPGTKLANELLKVGKFDEVATWVEKVGTVWGPDTTKGWLKTIRAKKIPTDEAWKDQFPF